MKFAEYQAESLTERLGYLMKEDEDKEEELLSLDGFFRES